MSQFGHTAWRLQDGFFNGALNAITQAAESYIWVGTQAGLLRFDGVHFVPWTAPAGKRLPSTTITALLGARDGSLWIGTEAGLAHWTGQDLITYPSENGRVNALLQDTHGTVWVAQSVTGDSRGSFCQVTGAKIRCHRQPGGSPDSGAGSLAAGAQGDLWVGCQAELLRWNSGAITTFRPRGLDAKLGGIYALAATPADSLWVGMGVSGPDLGLQQFVQGKWQPFRAPEFDSSTLEVYALLMDRDGTLWIGTTAQGIYRIHGNRVDRFSVVDGLSGDTVLQLMEDREGTVWAVTSRGLDSFRNLRVTTFSVREGLRTGEADAVLAARDGTVWIGGSGSLDAIRDGEVTSIQASQGLPGYQVTSLLEDRSGNLWAGIDLNLFRYRNGRFEPVETRDGKPLGIVVDLTEGANGDIWAETRATPRKLVRIEGLDVREEFPAPDMPEARRAEADTAGGLWLGLMNGDLARFRDGKLDVFPFEHSPHPSSNTFVSHVRIWPDGAVLGATPFGLIGWKQGQQRKLGMRNGLPCDHVYSFVADEPGNVWLYTRCGLVEITKAQLQAWWQQPDIRLHPRVLDMLDGVQPGLAPFDAAARAPDGRLWFVNGTAVQMLDPARLAGNTLPPPVRIEQLLADRRSYAPVTDVRLPPRTRDIQLSYTALSFVVPRRVRFRYWLDGHDEQWQEAGGRREAFYSDLPPGAYRFHVIASNNDGVWNETGATLRFDVAPAWYQMRWFRALCVVGAALILWAVYRIRMRQMAAALSARFDERLMERTRLARELHDTLLQSIEASKLVADTALSEPPDLARARSTLVRLSSWLGHAVHEGRVALNSLRSLTQRNDLAESLRLVAEDREMPGSMEVMVSVLGDVKSMHPIVRDEVNRIGSEAIRNARRHSDGTRLEIELMYGADLHLRIRDDGKGIPPSVAKHGKVGHFGLQGMRERAASIGGTLSFLATAGSGTEVRLIIPGGIAFSRQGRTER